MAHIIHHFSQHSLHHLMSSSSRHYPLPWSTMRLRHCLKSLNLWNLTLRWAGSLFSLSVTLIVAGLNLDGHDVHLMNASSVLLFLDHATLNLPLCFFSVLNLHLCPDLRLSIYFLFPWLRFKSYKLVLCCKTRAGAFLIFLSTSYTMPQVPTGHSRHQRAKLTSAQKAERRGWQEALASAISTAQSAYVDEVAHIAETHGWWIFPPYCYLIQLTFTI